jgi:hypothetical protein
MGCASVGAEASRSGDRRARGRRRGRGARTLSARRFEVGRKWFARFVNAQVPEEVVQPFGRAQAGKFIADAAVQVGTYRKRGTRWWRPAAVCAHAAGATSKAAA